MFIAALFTIAKTQKQLKCPLTFECLRYDTHTQDGILLYHRKNEIMPFAAT